MYSLLTFPLKYMPKPKPKSKIPVIQLQQKPSQNRIKPIVNKPLTLVTCWYTMKSKFPPQKYLNWIRNFVSIVKHFNLVIYTDSSSIHFFSFIKDMPQIQIIIRPIEQFHTNKFEAQWLQNHNKSELPLHKVIDWRLNMLWNEKIFFVKDAIERRIFDSPFYGWCDIGYFRNNPDDLHTDLLVNWAKNIETRLMPNIIHYGRVQNNDILFQKLESEIKSHYIYKLKTQPTNKYDEITYAGGFFIGTPQVLLQYSKIYDEKLAYYFENGYLIKDDQLIVMDIITMNPRLFCIHTEAKKYNNWFMFQRALL